MVWAHDPLHTAMTDGTRSPSAIVREIRRHKWLILQASALGFATFEILSFAAQIVASAMDVVVYNNVPSSVRSSSVIAFGSFTERSFTRWRRLSADGWSPEYSGPIR